MNIVETKKYGNTTVRFCDDCCKEMETKEAEQIIRQISDMTLPYLQTKSA